MTEEEKAKQITAFLKQVRGEVANNNFIFLRRCLPDIILLELTIEQAKHEIIGLRWHNYDRGPSPDHINDGTDVWVFGKLISGKTVYIKLKIHPSRGCICMSFKESDRPMTLPYKKKYYGIYL